MSVLLDIVFATFFGGIISLITINANLVIREAWAGYNSDVIIQQMLISDAQIVESEFRNMGCGLDTTKQTINIASDTCIEFNMALRPEPGTPITRIKYYSGSVAELASTDNPNDRFLYRAADGANPGDRVGIITRFNITYFNSSNDSLPTPIADPSTIGIVEITLEVQSPYSSYIGQDGKQYFASAMWKQTRLASQNLKR